MGFRDRFHIGLAAILLLFGGVVAAQAAVSQAEIARIKAKIEAGGALSTAEITRVEEINASTTSRIDLAAAFERARAHQAGADDEAAHGGAGALDIWQATAATFAWRDLSTVGTDVGITGDDSVSAPIALGIPFRWFGTTPTDVRVASNGYLLFSGNSNTSLNTALPSAAEPNNALYVFWDDLIIYPDSGDYVKYQARTDSFLVSWRVHRVGGTAPISFQAILRSGAGVNGRVVFQYQSLDVRNSCTVGIEDAAGQYALQMCYNGAGTMPGATNSAYTLGEPAQMPLPVTGLTAAQLGTSLNVALTWTNPTTDLYGTALTGGVDSTDIYLGTTLLGRVYGARATFGHANTATGSLTYTVYSWNSGFQSYPVQAAATVAPAVYDYADDFEASAGGWNSLFVAPTDTLAWQWGVPTYIAGPQAHSGTKLWGTNLQGKYGNNACYQVELNLGQPVTSTGAGIGFWAWYKSEGSGSTTADGTNFRVSTDGGANWQIVLPLIGGYDDSLTVTQNTCIGFHNPTWNGSRAVDSTAGITARWRYFVIPLGQFNGQTPQMRLVFGSDNQAANYPGFYFDDVTVWGITPGAGHTVSGSVTLDGGAGDVTQAVVRATGLGLVNAQPAANGAYSLAHVQAGSQVLWATLTGYQTMTLPVTVAGDLTGQNLTLRRLAPVAPVITASTINPAGVVTLDWDDSPDIMVDAYKIYSKLSSEPNSAYTLKRTIYGRLNSTGTDTLVSAETYWYVVTAVDTNVVAPALESVYSNHVELMMGALPPLSLYGRGDWDTHVRLSWIKPGMQPLVEMSYDNGVNSLAVSGIGFTSLQNFGWFAARYHTASAVAVHRLRVYFTSAATVGDRFEVGLFADNGAGRPTTTPRSMLSMTMAAPLDQYRDFVLAAPDTFASGTFYVGVRQVTANRLAIGGDVSTPFVPNTFFYAPTQFAWSSFDTSTTMMLAIPMMRAVAQTIHGALVELAPQPIETGSAFEQSAWASALSDPSLSKEARAAQAQSQIPTYLTDEAAANVSQFIDSRLSTMNPNAEPFIEALPAGPHSGGLDEVSEFRIYRNATQIGTTLPTVTAYNDSVAETSGAGYSYTVTARYPNGTESDPSNLVVVTPRMAPAAPTTLAGAGNMTDSTMRLTWTDPAQNADGTPCTDLTRILIYRDNQLKDSVAAGVREYTDQVQYPSLSYTWSLRAADEVRNLSPAVTLTAAAAPPWLPRPIDWVDISETGTSTGLTGDDQLSAAIGLGFTFPFYGQDYSSVKVCSNGFLTFLTASTSTNLSNAAIPNTTEPNAAIYPFWDDVDADDAGAWVKYQAEADRFIISWHEPLHSGGVLFDFQVILEQTGAITMQYLTLPATLNSYTVGVENAAGTTALMLYNNGAGLWTPTVGSAVRFFDFPLVYVAASGHVSLDGGAGQLSDVQVSVTGAGLPTAMCDASGNFEFDSVAFGPRIFSATLTGYNPASVSVNVPLAGIEDVALTLRRQAPPSVTGFTASIVSLTQVVTLNWTESADTLVDLYKIFRRTPAQSSLQLYKTLRGRHISTLPDTLVNITGAVQYAITAVDTNVTTPWVESGQATASVTGGHPAPWGLTTNGVYDDLIHVEWHAPDEVALMEAGYDNGHNSASVNGIGWWGAAPAAGWIATRFELGAPATVQGVSSYFTAAATVGAPVQVALYADANGQPDNRPLAVVDGEITGALGTFQRIDFTQPVRIESGTFYVAVRQMTDRALGLGGDDATPYVRGTFTHSTDGSVWEANEPVLTAIPMLRAVVTQTAWDELAGTTRIPERKLVKAESFGKTYGPRKGVMPAAGRSDKADAGVVQPVLLTSGSSASADQQGYRLETALEPHAPQMSSLAATTPHGGAGALDEVVSFHVYRDGVEIAEVPRVQTYYNDMDLIENVPHTYYATAEYDDGVQSNPSNSSTARSNMSPAAATGLAIEPVGGTMVLTWIDPTENTDHSPLNDLVMVYIERYLGTSTTMQMRDSVLPGVQTYTDTPPVQTQLYTWKIRSRDEVPNYSPYITITGIVESPWHAVQYEWVDISTTGTWLAGCGSEDANLGSTVPAPGLSIPLGFTFPFYGNDYDSVRICTNGWMSFTERTSVSWAERQIPNAEVPNNCLFPFWDDLVADTALSPNQWIKYKAEPGRFIVTWQTRKHTETMATPAIFQVILTPDSSVLFQYQAVPVNVTTFSLGVENLAGNVGIQLNYDQVDSTFRPRAFTAVRFWGGQSGSVAGNVTSGSGLPIANASVWATNETFTSEVIHSDNLGRFSLRLPPASYTLHAEHPSYCGSTHDIVIQNNIASTQNMQLLAPSAQFNVTSFTLESRAGHDTTATFTIRNLTGQCPLSFTIADTSAWLSADPDTGEVPVGQTLTVTVYADVDTFEVHAHLQSRLVVTYNSGTSPRNIPVDIDVLDTTGAVGPHGEVLPTVFALQQNYPNPFNPTTELRFDVPRESFVKLVVYNVMGQEVATAVNSRMPAGRHRVTFDAGTLPTGMYLVRMDADGFSAVSKMMLLK